MENWNGWEATFETLITDRKCLNVFIQEMKIKVFKTSKVSKTKNQNLEDPKEIFLFFKLETSTKNSNKQNTKPFLFKKADLLCFEAAMLRDLTDVIKAQLGLQDGRKCVKGSKSGETCCGICFFKE